MPILFLCEVNFVKRVFQSQVLGHVACFWDNTEMKQWKSGFAKVADIELSLVQTR